MRNVWQAHREKIAVAWLVVVLLVLMSTFSGTHEHGRAVGTSTGWLAWNGNRLLSGFGDAWRELTGGGLNEQNERLKDENAQLREEKTRLIGVLQENARLRDLVKQRERFDAYHLVSARVIGRDTTPYFRVVKIKVQAEASVAVGDAVLGSEGLVGSVWSVDEPFADVLMVPDPRSRVDVVAQRNRAHGIVEGLGLGKNHHARVAYLRREDRVRTGDLFVTSGLGDMFPPEVPVGRVTSVVRADAGIFQEVVVEPTVDFTRLREVFVVRSEDR